MKQPYGSLLRRSVDTLDKADLNRLAHENRTLLDALPQHWSVRQAARAAYMPYRKAMRVLHRLGYRFELLDPRGLPVLGIHIRREVKRNGRRARKENSNGTA